MSVETITSRQNPLMRKIVKLGGKARERRAEKEYVCDGDKLLSEALRSGVVPNVIIAAEGKELPELPDDIRVVRVPYRLLESVAPTDTPQGVLFVCGLKEKTFCLSREGKYILLDGVQDAGNVGAILRSGEAFGIDAVLLREGCADPFGPKAVRASMGSIFRQEVFYVKLPDIGTMTLFAAESGGSDVRNINWGPCVVAIGCEGRGLSREVLERADGRISIPMRGKTESLNAAAAASILLWEMSR